MRFGFLSKYFPPPRYLRPSHAGVSFSDSEIKAIYFDKTLNEPSLKSAAIPLEKGAIVAGSVVNADEVVKALSLVKEHLDIPYIFFTIPDELAYVFSATTTVGAKGGAAENVAFIMEENVPLSLADTVFDFVPTSIRKSDSEYSADFVVAACVKKEVMKFSEAIRRAGLEPVGCAHESQAISRSVIADDFHEVSCIIHTRSNRIGIYLVKDNLVHFSTLRSILTSDYKQPFLDEYNKFLDYCLKLEVTGKRPIENVFVCGEFEYAKQTVEALVDSSEELKNIKLSNVWTNVFEIDKHLPEIPYERSLGFAGPVGAVLSDII